MARKEGLLAIFIYVDDLLSALRKLKSSAHAIDKVFSPLPVLEVQEILDEKPSNVRIITFLGGILSALGVMGLAIYAHLSFSLITSGKPVLPWVPWVVVCFEAVILGAVVCCVIAWVLMGRLPRSGPVQWYDVRFSQDRFGLLVVCSGKEENDVRKLLEQSGAEEVRHVGR